MNLSNKVLRGRGKDGQDLFILAGKPIDDKKSIYLLNTMSNEPNYSLWNVEYIDEEHFQMSPYKGSDTEELIEELLDVFIENAHEVL